MPAWIFFAKNYTDYLILGSLALMSFVMLWKVIERYIFFAKVDITKYSNIYSLDIELNRNLTFISTIGANAPYVGLLGTVIGVLLTFYELGFAGQNIEASAIMLNLSLALKATAVGILVAIPSMIFYNALSRKVEVCKLRWQAFTHNKNNQAS